MLALLGEVLGKGYNSEPKHDARNWTHFKYQQLAWVIDDADLARAWTHEHARE
jgi:hypothetical protein